MKKFFILNILIVGFFGFTHFIGTNDSFIIIPKLSFTYSDTFITIDEIITRYNQQSIVEKIRGDPRLDNIIRVLQSKQLITTKTNIEPIPTQDENLQKTNAAVKPYQHTNYSDIKSAILDGQNAIGKTIQFYAKFNEISIYSSKPVLYVTAETETGSSLWYINFDDSYKNVVSGFTKNQRLDIMCTISEIRGSVSSCELIKFL